MDKKISQLPLASGINPSDISVLVDADTSEQFSFSQLLTFLSANLPKGAIITFGTSAIPSSGGNNGDVYVKTDTGQFAQKQSGTWGVVYTIVQGVIGSKVYFGASDPSFSFNANRDDVYIRTTNGAFYKNTSLSSGSFWTLEFSMATGPTGPQGPPGTNGTNGTNGLSVLNGVSNPSNLLDGVNGDFYINTTTWQIFGPKTAGVWGLGTSLIGTSVLPSKRLNFPIGTALPIVFSSFQTLYSAYGSNPRLSLRKISGGGLVTAIASTPSTTAAAGTYTAQAIINRTSQYNSTGVGDSGTATIVVSGVSGSATVTNVTIVDAGECYYIGDTFTIAAIPGAIFTVTANSELFYMDLSAPGSITIGENIDLFPDSISINTDDDGTGHLQDNLQIVISL